MKNKEITVTKNSRFTISKNTEISECVEKYSYQNDSEFIRIAVELLLKFHKHQEEFKDPEKMIIFAKEIDPLITAEKKERCLTTLLLNSSPEELERFYFAISQERCKRVKDKTKRHKDKQFVLQWGGELEPKVGYVLRNVNDIECYKPITPDYKEWQDLSTDDKEVLLMDLKQKRVDLETIFPKPEDSSEDFHFRAIDFTIKKITEGIAEDIE